VDGIDEHDGEVTDYLGAPLNEDRFRAFGGDRYPDEITETTMHFTGQREEESLGIYFYNARYYDPMLGRFLQADSIVPNPGDPVAWDRYAYARNNPIRYNDPTGHAYYDPGCDCMVYEPHPPTPTPPDPVALDAWGNKMEELYETYRDYRMEDDSLPWWNLDGDSTPYDFLILILAYEFQPYINYTPISGSSRGQPGTPTFEEDLSHASTHSFNVECAINSSSNMCNGITTNAIFDYVGDLGSGRGKYAAMLDGTLLANTSQAQANIALATIVANAILNAPTNHPEWTLTGIDYSTSVSGNEPWSWGNGSMLAISLEAITPDLYLWMLPGATLEKYAYVFTVNQCILVGCGTIK
jgi:RHS repeat-associated protein